METIVQFLENSVDKFGDNVFLMEKNDGVYQSTTYKETKIKVEQLANGLLKLGINKNDHVALLSEGRNDWIISELAILYCGAVNVPLSIKLESQEILFRVNHSKARVLMVSRQQATKIEKIKSQFKTVETIIYLDRVSFKHDNEFLLSDVVESGIEYQKLHPELLIERKSLLKPSDYANITYTSGTTSDPKGIILSHKNFTANVKQAYSLMDIPEWYKTLLILPLDHCFAHVAGIYSFMGKGAALAMVEMGNSPLQTLKNIPKNIREIKPNLLLSVPALAKNFKKNIDKGIKEKGKFTYSLYKLAIKNAYKYNKEGYNKGTNGSFWRKPFVWLFDVILFRKIRLFFGGELKYFIGGGALLDIELQRFFYAIGIPMMQGYGLSEATPIISSNSLNKHKLGSSGFFVNNMEVKICDDNGNSLPNFSKGEIVIKGDNVMVGYWQNSEATKETVIDGWLHTGDMGYVDNDGFLYVLGRFKSLLISSDGEKYSPEAIEEALVEKTKFIDQIVLHNNQDPYTIGLIYPDYEALRAELKRSDVRLSSNEGKQLALNLLNEEINHFKKGGKYSNEFPERWLPSAVALLEEGFNEKNKLMNSTMKVVRGKVTERYKDKIDYLYNKGGKRIDNQINIEALSKVE